MDEFEEKGKRARNQIEKGSICDGFSSASKLQNSSAINSQATMYKFNLAACLHDHAYDHVSCTKLQPDLSRTEGGLITLAATKENEEQLSNFHKLPQAPDHDETFKDIILVQLDLIQHQQEQLLKKERQLQQARQDSESLCKRLESMEKEIASLREQLSRKDENRLGRGSDFLEVNRDECLESQLTFTNFLTDLPSTGEHVASASASKTAEPSEQQASIANELTSTIAGRKSEDKKRKKAPSKLDQSESNKEEKKSIAGSKRKKSDKDKAINDRQQPESPQPAVHQQLRFPYQTIETDNPYEIVTNKHFFNALEDDDELDPLHREEQLSKSEQIEIPSWRLHPISCSYSLEGTENLNDEVFQHRHSKFEMDEKRRKRWDLQRLRESHYNERLRSRYSSNSKAITANSGQVNLNSSSTTSSQALVNSDNNSNDVSSFYPSPNILKYIEVSERLPVVAFGHCIPELPAKDFSLPWSSSNNSNSNKAPATSHPKAASKKNPL